MRNSLPKLAALALTATLALPTASATAQGPEAAKPAGQIFADAITAMEHVTNFHVVGDVRETGQAIKLNLTMSTHGGGGSITLRGATLDVVVTKKYLYMKADANSWKILSGGSSSGAAAAALLAGKWLKVPVTNPHFGSFADFTVSTKFLTQITKQKVQFSKAGEATWHTRSVILLHDSKGATVYVATKAPHYVLGVEGSNASGTGSLQFSDFGDAPMPAIPLKTITLPGL